MQWQEEGLAKDMTAERYGKNGNRAFGLLTVICSKKEQLPLLIHTIMHNLLVIGRDVEDMVLAANA